MAEDAELNLLLWDGEHLDIHKIFGEQFPKESFWKLIKVSSNVPRAIRSG